MGRIRRDRGDAKRIADTRSGQRQPPARPVPPGNEAGPATNPASPRLFLGKAVPRGYGEPPRLSLDAAASFATLVDTARARAAMEGRTLVYTVRWG